MSVDLRSGRVKYISGRVEILVSLPTQNAGRRHASCGERAWTSTCPPPVSTMAGRLIDKLRLRSQKPGPVRAVRDMHCLFVPVPSHAQHLAYSTSNFLHTTNVDSLAIHPLPLWLSAPSPAQQPHLPPDTSDDTFLTFAIQKKKQLRNTRLSNFMSLTQ